MLVGVWHVLRVSGGEIWLVFGHVATTDRGSASGIYLACYFFGGLVGTAVLGQLFDRFGWEACVSGIAVALTVAALLAYRLKISSVPHG